MTRIVGLFDYHEDADRAVQALKENGFDNSQISLVAREADSTKRGTTTAGTGAATGAAAGGLLGLVAGIGAVMIPGIGPELATGVIANALATTIGMTAVGAGIGAATGGMIGALVDTGLSREDAEVYAEGVKRGGVLVFVDTTSQNEEMARVILDGAGAVNADSRRETWQNDGWTAFDETEFPDEEEEYRRNKANY
jgi:uncharacterized membrane protein